MRDPLDLKKLKKQKNTSIKILGDFRISLLANEGCWGNCPVQDEHFEFNFSGKVSKIPNLFCRCY